MRHGSWLLCWLLVASLTPVRAADLLVQPGNPAAFQTLQAALDAASPGDRILIGADLLADQVIVQKSVTIEPLGTGRVRLALAPSPFGGQGELRIAALSPNLPLTLRRIDVFLYEIQARPEGIQTVGAVPGEIRFDDVQLEWVGNQGQSQFGSGCMVDLDTTVVWCRGCQWVAQDMQNNLGCIDIDGIDGVDCLRVRAETLRLEDCQLRAASANHLGYSCCFGEPPACSGQVFVGGHGGAAMLAITRNTILVRCSFSDGNGGTVEPGPWPGTPAGGALRPSQFGGQSGVVDPFAVSWEQGQPGHVGLPHAARGATSTFGAPAPLSIVGPVTPGTFLGVQWNSPLGSIGVFLAGIAWGETPTPLGRFWTQPFAAFTHQGGGATENYPLPPAPALIGLPIVLQGVNLFPLPSIGNPSGVAIR